MKAYIDDIQGYAFCPIFNNLAGPPLAQPAVGSLHELFSNLMTYVFRRELEIESKTSWKSILSRWTKIFWLHHPEDDPTSQKLFNRSQVSIRKFYDWYLALPHSPLAVSFTISQQLRNHQVIAEIPVILETQDSKVVPLFFEPLIGFEGMIRSLKLRVATLLLDKSIPVSSFSNSYMSLRNSFSTFEAHPTPSFWSETEGGLLQILDSMQNRISYPNSHSCHICPRSDACKADLL